MHHGTGHDGDGHQGAVPSEARTQDVPAPSLDRLAVSAAVHCLTGCAIGEVLGMVIGTSLGWSNAATIAISVALAFAGLAAFPVNRSLIARGRGQAVVHRHLGSH